MTILGTLLTGEWHREQPGPSLPAGVLGKGGPMGGIHCLAALFPIRRSFRNVSKI